jgi:hypothetical protein
MTPKPKPLKFLSMHSQLSTYTFPEWAAVVGLVLVVIGLVVGTYFA